MAQVKEALLASGYERYEQVEGPGQFAVRGGICLLYTSRCV